MSTSGGTRAIIAALLANLGIAVTKFIAYLLSGSSSMLAESVHSLADSGNQVLLLIGGKRASREATPEHPFGYGRERYVYAFLVSIILFSVGGVFSIYEGVHKIEHPEPINVPWLPIAVLLISIVLESFSLRTALKESAAQRRGISILQFVRRAKAPELTWLRSDLTAVAGLADAPFDVVVLAGNVMTFVAPGTEVPILSALTAQLAPTGLLVVPLAQLPTFAGSITRLLREVEAKTREAQAQQKPEQAEPLPEAPAAFRFEG